MATIDQKFQKLISKYDEHCRRISKATFININETAPDKLRRVKGLETDYIRWFEYYFPNYAQCKCAWFHKQFADDMIRNTEIYELLEIYRSGAKSVHADMGVPLYLYYSGRLKFMLLSAKTIVRLPGATTIQQTAH